MGASWRLVFWWTLPLACGFAATAELRAELAPALGTWHMKQDGKADARTITVAFLRRQGDEYVGVIEFWPDGPNRTLETFTARVDAARRTVRFDGRESYSRVEGIAPGTYEADLAADGRSMTRFRSISHLSTGVTSTLRWQNGQVPTYEPAVMASLAVREDRHRLWHQMAANCLVDGLAVKPGNDRLLLERLARSGHPRTRELARARLRFVEFFLQAQAENDEAAKEFARDDLQRRMELLKFLSDVTSDNTSPQSIGALMKSAGLEQAFDRRRAKVQLAMVQAAFFNRCRTELRADFQEGSPGAAKRLPSDKLTTEFKANRLRSYLAARNNTGRDLHHCLIVPRMAPDQAKVDEFEKAVKADNSLAPHMGVVFDVNFASLAESQTLLVKYHRLDKGMPAYLPLWRAGETVEVEVGPPDAIRESAGSMSLWIGSEEGQVEQTLDVVQVRALARAAAPAKTRSAKPGERTTAARPESPPTKPSTFRPPEGQRRPMLPGGGAGLRFGPGGNPKDNDKNAPPPRETSAPKPANARDLFYVGSLWRGREYQLAKSFVAVDIEVLERDGDHFRAQMRWDGRHGRFIEGTITKDGKVEWRGAKDERNAGTPHTGQLAGTKLEGEYSRPLSKQRLTFVYEYVAPVKK